MDVLLEDNVCLGVNKPAGILTQGPPVVDLSLAQQARAYLKEKYAKTGRVYLGIPHRLDRVVSGVVLFARTSKAAARLAEQFRDRQVRKLYWTIVENPPQPAEGSLVAWLDKHPTQPKAFVTPKITPTAREASLRYRTVKETPLGTLVEIELGTGRFHQIRVQMAAHGCPVVGDTLYGATRTFPVPPEIMTRQRDERCDLFIALHARQLTFFHPVRYDLITITAPLPSYWPAAREDSPSFG